MNLTPWKRNRELSTGRYFPELSSVRAEIDHLFEQFLKSAHLPSTSFGRKGEWIPSLDVTDNEKEITVKCELPGIDAKDVDVSLKGNMLTIKGEKKTEHIEDTDDYYVAERGFGSFVRSIELPDSVDSDSINAEQKDGILTIQLKKRPGAGQKKIPVAAKS